MVTTDNEPQAKLVSDMALYLFKIFWFQDLPCPFWWPHCQLVWKLFSFNRLLFPNGTKKKDNWEQSVPILFWVLLLNPGSFSVPWMSSTKFSLAPPSLFSLWRRYSSMLWRISWELLLRKLLMNYHEKPNPPCSFFLANLSLSYLSYQKSWFEKVGLNLCLLQSPNATIWFIHSPFRKYFKKKGW